MSSYSLETSKCRRSRQVRERAGGLEGLPTRVISARQEGASDGPTSPGQMFPGFFSSQVLPVLPSSVAPTLVAGSGPRILTEMKEESPVHLPCGFLCPICGVCQLSLSA